MNDPTVNSPIGVRPDYNDVQCDDVMPRVGTDSEGPGLYRLLKTGLSFEKVSPWSPDKVHQHGIGQ